PRHRFLPAARRPPAGSQGRAGALFHLCRDEASQALAAAAGTAARSSGKGMTPACPLFRGSFGRDADISNDRRRRPADYTGRPHREGLAMTSLAHLQKTRLSSLEDPRLFREFAYVDGAWPGGTGRAALDVTNPADSTRLGTV